MSTSEKAKEAKRKRDNLATERLADSYIKKLLTRGKTMRAADIPQDFVEAKRAHMRVYRALREQASKKAKSRSAA